jgi:hypothetical protein
MYFADNSIELGKRAVRTREIQIFKTKDQRQILPQQSPKVKN